MDVTTAVQERDYGCGDPSAFARSGKAVLDLGSGGGKICFIAAQIVGAGGSRTSLSTWSASRPGSSIIRCGTAKTSSPCTPRKPAQGSCDGGSCC